MAFFFPASLTVFFFRYNRAAYDVLSQTVVVEVEPGQQWFTLVWIFHCIHLIMWRFTVNV